MEHTTQLLRDEKQRERCRRLLSTPQPNFDNFVDAIGWESIVISNVRTEAGKACIGKNMVEIAAEQGKDPLTAVFDLLVQESCDVAMVNHICSEKDLETIIGYPFTCVISDALYAEGGRSHPRRYGAFPRIIEEYVNKRRIIDLPRAVQKMTGMPAEILSIQGKGFLKEGYDADIAVFNPSSICTTATFTDPERLATGFSYVLVGGKIVNDHDKLINNYNGRFIAGPAADNATRRVECPKAGY